MMYKYEPQALQQLGMQQQPFDPSAGIGEFERRQFLPYNQPEPTQQPFDPSAGIGDFEARQFQPYNQQEPTQAPRQQSYQPLPQAPGMQPFLQQFRTQQRPYQLPFQQRSGQMFPNSEEGGQSNSAYNYNSSLFGRLNNLAPLNKNALNFSY
jgi:hypothetical protein